MKYRLLLFTFFILFVSVLFAQQEEISSHKLNWKGVQKWHAGTSSINVICFDSAQYPGEKRLPYFNKRMICDPSCSYEVKIKNPVYIPLSIEESRLLSGVSLNKEFPVIETKMLHNRGTSFLNVSLLPFVIQNGTMQKLQSFDLQILKTSQPQKLSPVNSQKGLGSNSRTYTTTSVLAQGKFVKIKITDSGIYKLTFEDLVSMGIDPANVHVFGYGGGLLQQSFLLPKMDDLPEVAIYMNKGADGVFNSGDYILFYAQGITKWSYDYATSMFIHKVNTYSSYGYYFVSSDAGTGRKIEVKQIVLPNPAAVVNTIEEFTDFQVYEKDLINLAKSGKEFYGETFNDITSYVFTFNFPNAVTTNSTMVHLDVAATPLPNSNFSLDLNRQQTKKLDVVVPDTTNKYEIAKQAWGVYAFTPQSDVLNFNISYIKSRKTSVGYLNYLEVNTRRHLTMVGSVMPFQNVDFLGQANNNQYLLSNANSKIQIWDITDPQNITQIATSTVNGKMSFTDSGNDIKNYLAIDPTASSVFNKPDIIGVVPNQNLHGIAQADMVILTHPDFLPEAQTLAQAHRDKDKMTVAVVTTEQVYNEFSSGTPDATAYRWMMKMLYDRALTLNNLTDLPKYLLLFGKGTYDNRKLLSGSGYNFIMTFQAENSLVLTDSYVTDDYFALLDDSEGSQVTSDLMDIGVGRFTVTTTQQAIDVVNKTIGYMNNQGKGYWKNQVCFLADNGDESLHSKQADSIAVSITKKYPSYQVNKIYLDSYLQEVSASGRTFPLAKSRLLNLLRSGLFLINYTGHASSGGWDKSIFTSNDVKSLTNQHLPLFVAATCDFVQFDDQILSAGEQVIFNATGGGIGILASARPVYASQNFTLDKLFCETLLSKRNGSELRIGDILADTKNNLGTETNKLSYVYIGDPAIRLNYPTKYQIITSKINQSTTTGNDTLSALSVATIQGIVADANGNRMNDFNGNIHSVVFDKVQRITTLNNEGDGAMSYSDRPNTLFSGDTKVINGNYSFSFKLPKDIKYNFGGGRINYYANDDTNNYEAQGYFENFIIGGTDTNAVYESVGPKVDLYLNSKSFVSGQKVNETPLFFANLSDSAGINTSGSGIGHDVTLTVDQDPDQTYMLNDYFQANTDSYTSGVVNYKMPVMTNGKHTLTLRVWDLLDNSTVSTINFEVVTGLPPQILSVYNYPNPVKTKTTIIVNNDQPEKVINTAVEIFDLSGRKIWSFSQPNAEDIQWNLISNSGQRVKTGIYLYRVSIKTKNSKSTSKTNKMLVVEQ